MRHRHPLQFSEYIRIIIYIVDIDIYIYYQQIQTHYIPIDL